MSLLIMLLFTVICSRILESETIESSHWLLTKDYILELNSKSSLFVFNTFEQKSSNDILIKCVHECNKNNHLKF